MTFLPMVFSLALSGSVAAAFISIMLSGLLDTVGRLFYIYFGWGNQTDRISVSIGRPQA